MVTVNPTDEQVNAAMQAGRDALNNYSEFDSSMVPDDALETFCRAVLTAALNLPKPNGVN